MIVHQHIFFTWSENKDIFPRCEINGTRVEMLCLDHFVNIREFYYTKGAYTSFLKAFSKTKMQLFMKNVITKENILINRTRRLTLVVHINAALVILKRYHRHKSDLLQINLKIIVSINRFTYLKIHYANKIRQFLSVW